jgi:DNA-binding IclR family transcriptional regulator
MPCLQPDGTLSRIGILILQAVRQPATVEAISKESGLPLFRARSAVRGLVKATLVEKAGQGYAATRLGLEKLEDSK